MKKRGFAAMSPEKRRQISSKGGKAAQRKGTGHRYTTSAEAAAAGSKGGKASVASGKGHKFTSETARAARRKSLTAKARKSLDHTEKKAQLGGKDNG
jgi:hypothetical protein